MPVKARIAFELEKEDSARLRQEADKLGMGNISALLRLLIKQFFAKVDKGESIFT